ncbi:MAG: glycosyltransferase family 2 protein [bacterium]|nr:glycosyltransferase family 2 protein [bacterium]
MLSVIIPALNEEDIIKETIGSIRTPLKKANIIHEIIVINDGSSDHTGKIALECGVEVITHPKPSGYGKSLKDGILKAQYDLIAITDADGTYPNDRLLDLYNIVIKEGYDMAVGARTGKAYQGTFLKMPARKIFLWLSEYATGEKIDDINSGLRVFKKEIPLGCWNVISNSFSFTTTITLAAFSKGYFVKYISIDYHKRIGKSHVRYWRDTLRSFQIIVENILYYNPLKLFLLLVNTSLIVSLLSGGIYIIVETPKIFNFFGNLSVYSFASAIVVAGIGLLADLVRISKRMDDKK